MQNKLFLNLILISLTFASCKENEPAPYHEEELITTVELHFTEVENPGNHFVITYKDIDGVGGNDAVQSAPINLKQNISYNVEVKVKDESDDNNIEDLTEEVRGEGTDHQFFFAFDPSSLVTHSYADADDAGKPIGLSNTFVAQTPGSGNLTVTLKHEPNKEAEGAATGNMSAAGGETDIEANFNITVE